MRCPFCGDEASRVVDTRVGREGAEIRRRRECQECGGRFTTRERVEETLPRIIKRDERREEYERAKLQAAIERACEKRPVSPAMLELLVERIERRLQELGEKEVESRWVGERAMEELVALDPMAAVRFASVFNEFHSAEDYTRFFESVGSAPSSVPSKEGPNHS